MSEICVEITGLKKSFGTLDVLKRYATAGLAQSKAKALEKLEDANKQKLENVFRDLIDDLWADPDRIPDD